MADKFRVTVRANDIELRGHVMGYRKVQAVARAMKSLGVMVLVSAWEDEPEGLDQRPHSRACGIAQHVHGLACSSDCPTCGGE